MPLLLALVLTIAGTLAAPAAAGITSKAASHLQAGLGLELHLKSFNLHEGNTTCGAGQLDDRPALVPAGKSDGFCYRSDGYPRSDPTEFTFKYTIWLSHAGRLVDSGYTLWGHAEIVAVHVGVEMPNNQWGCGIEKTNPNAAIEHFDCQLTTERDAKGSDDPVPTWKVTFQPTPEGVPKVFFIGDSVTAGFGYCGTEGGANSANINCGPNESMADSWKGETGLRACAPPDEADFKPVNDRCSNNNSLGAPWSAGPWFPDPNAPDVAYPYVIAKQQSGALVYDWAMTGSIPADWDPDRKSAFGDQTKTIRNSYVVMTLGANPLLAAYVKITVFGIKVTGGQCAETTTFLTMGRLTRYAAPLDGTDRGVLRCLNEKWDSLEQGKHLLNVYKTLLANGNHVLVLGYPLGCPWTFGTWQPAANLFVGPSKGHACTSETLPEYGTLPPPRLSQFDQARALANHLNAKIDAVVKQAAASAGGQGKIFFALPDQAAWTNHQAWSSDPWVFKNDTWVHPNGAGHKQLAATVLTAMCAHFRHWCRTPPKWDFPKPDCRRNPKLCEHWLSDRPSSRARRRS